MFTKYNFYLFSYGFSCCKIVKVLIFLYTMLFPTKAWCMIHVQLQLLYVTFSRKWLRPCHAKRHHIMPSISSFIYLSYIFHEDVIILFTKYNFYLFSYGFSCCKIVKVLIFLYTKLFPTKAWCMIHVQLQLLYVTFSRNGCAHVMLKDITSCQVFLHLYISRTFFMRNIVHQRAGIHLIFSQYLHLCIGVRFSLTKMQNQGYSTGYGVIIISHRLS